MNSNEIRDTLFPHEKTIRELNARYTALEEKYLWLREHGVMLANAEGGSLFLKGDAFDKFFADGCVFPVPEVVVTEEPVANKKARVKNG